MLKHMWPGLLGLALAIGFTACDNDDDDDHGEHLEAVGVALVQDGDTLAMATSADTSDVSGEIHLHEGESRGPILVHFLDDEGHWFRPAEDPDGDHSLEILHNQLLVSVALDAANWAFTITGVEEGETALVVRILHNGHADYVSPELPVHVEHSEGAHGEPVGLRLLAGDSLVVETFANGTLSGVPQVRAGHGLDLSAWFVDGEGAIFQIDEEGHTLGVTPSGSLLDILVGEDLGGGATPWDLRLTGLAAGTDTLVFRVLHDGHAHFASPAIPVAVVAP